MVKQKRWLEKSKGLIFNVSVTLRLDSSDEFGESVDLAKKNDSHLNLKKLKL
jgi:hypothetical protein